VTYKLSGCYWPKANIGLNFVGVNNVVKSIGEHIDCYISRITPRPNDPTYSILKAHLLFEEMLRDYLKRKLPNAAALDGARLSFSQRLALSRSLTPVEQVQGWIWTGVEKLNTLRNYLAHGAGSKDVEKEIDKYVKFFVGAAGAPLPEPLAHVNGSTLSIQSKSPQYLAVDMVTIRMYYMLARELDYEVE
jgi:hypothetical protein